MIVLLSFTLVACGGQTQAAGSSPPRIVTIVASNFGYEPDLIEVRRGEKIHFVFENPTDLPHEIFIGSEAAQADHAALLMAAGTDVAAVDAGIPAAVYVPAGGAAQLTYRFDDPDATIIGCHLVGHWESGMRAEIVFLE